MAGLPYNGRVRIRHEGEPVLGGADGGVRFPGGVNDPSDARADRGRSGGAGGGDIRRRTRRGRRLIARSPRPRPAAEPSGRPVGGACALDATPRRCGAERRPFQPSNRSRRQCGAGASTFHPRGPRPVVNRCVLFSVHQRTAARASCPFQPGRWIAGPGVTPAIRAHRPACVNRIHLTPDTNALARFCGIIAGPLGKSQEWGDGSRIEPGVRDDG